MTALAFVDTETTGLDPDRHEVWEVGLILRDDHHADTEYQWQLPVDLGRADAEALAVGGYYERWSADLAHHPWDFAGDFARLTHGAVFVGANPSFDTAFLTRLLRASRACPGWHYRPVCVTTLSAGWLAHDPDSMPMPPPWSSNEISAFVGVDSERFDRHTALGDARWARDIYDAVMGS